MHCLYLHIINYPRLSSKTFCLFAHLLVSLQPKALPRSVAGVIRHERKVRAAQGAPLLKMEAIGDSRLGQKRTTAALPVRAGKGEKVV